MFNLLHLLLVVATQITRSWCLHDTTINTTSNHGVRTEVIVVICDVFFNKIL